MTALVFRKNRLVVPRWRPLARVLASGELFMSKAPATLPTGLSSELVERLETWRRRTDVITAAELVETALVEGMEFEAVNAARTLVAPNTTATPLVRKQASLLLQRVGELRPPTSLALNIRQLRARAYDFPQDAFAWADLALAYIVLSKKKAAKRAMSVALHIAPHDRQILRSAARMFFHLDDRERAHDLLKNNIATKFDPWLVAGEIALAGAASRKPTFLKIGNSMLEGGNFRAMHLSELASAVGTVHLQDGNRKARKLFAKSLIDPTGNSLAQAEWANLHLTGLSVSPQQLARVPDSGEARAFQAYWAGDFKQLISECALWANEEPFSARPFIFGSYAALTIDDLESGLEFAREGLQRDPRSAVLRNDLAYALIAKNMFDAGALVLKQTLAEGPDDQHAGMLIATSGMLAIRLGEVETGIAQYRTAMSHLNRAGNRLGEAIAAAYLAVELARSGHPESMAVIKEAEALGKDMKVAPELKIVLNRARTWLAAVEHRSNAMSVGAPRP